MQFRCRDFWRFLAVLDSLLRLLAVQRSAKICSETTQAVKTHVRGSLQREREQQMPIICQFEFRFFYFRLAHMQQSACTQFSFISLSNIRQFTYTFNFRLAHMQQSAERSLIICQFEIRLRILSQYNYKVYVVMCWPRNQCDLLLFGSVGQLLRHCWGYFV